jgi:hypothetical protein
MFQRGCVTDAHYRGGQAAAITNAQLAREFYAPIIPIVVELRNQGLSLRAIAGELDRRGTIMRFEQPPPGYPPVHDGHWNASQVRRVLLRAAGRTEAQEREVNAAKRQRAAEAKAAETKRVEEARKNFEQFRKWWERNG